MKCNYEEIDCLYVNTSGMTMDKECSDCEHYDKGISPTGATPVLAWVIEKIEKLWKSVF